MNPSIRDQQMQTHRDILPPSRIHIYFTTWFTLLLFPSLKAVTDNGVKVNKIRYFNLLPAPPLLHLSSEIPFLLSIYCLPIVYELSLSERKNPTANFTNGSSRLLLLSVGQDFYSL